MNTVHLTTTEYKVLKKLLKKQSNTQEDVSKLFRKNSKYDLAFNDLIRKGLILCAKNSQNIEYLVPELAYDSFSTRKDSRTCKVKSFFTENLTTIIVSAIVSLITSLITSAFTGT